LSVFSIIKVMKEELGPIYGPKEKSKYYEELSHEEKGQIAYFDSQKTLGNWSLILQRAKKEGVSPKVLEVFREDAEKLFLKALTSSVLREEEIKEFGELFLSKEKANEIARTTYWEILEPINRNLMSVSVNTLPIMKSIVRNYDLSELLKSDAINRKAQKFLILVISGTHPYLRHFLENFREVTKELGFPDQLWDSQETREAILLRAENFISGVDLDKFSKVIGLSNDQIYDLGKKTLEVVMKRPGVSLTNIRRVIDIFRLGSSIFDLPDVKEALYQIMRQWVAEGNFLYLSELIPYLSDVLVDFGKKYREDVKVGAIKLLSSGMDYKFVKWVRFFEVDTESVGDFIKDYLRQRFSSGNFEDDITFLKNLLTVADVSVIVNSEEFRPGVEKSLESLISKGVFYDVDIFYNDVKFNWTPSKAMDFAVKLMKKSLSEGIYGYVGHIQEDYNVPENLAASILISTIKDLLSYRLFDSVVSIVKNLKISKELFKKEFSDDSGRRLLRTLLSEVIVNGEAQSENYEENYEEGHGGNFSFVNFDLLVDELGIDSDLAREAAESALVDMLDFNLVFNAFLIRQRFGSAQDLLDDPRFKEVIPDAYISDLIRILGIREVKSLNGIEVIRDEIFFRIKQDDEVADEFVQHIDEMEDLPEEVAYILIKAGHFSTVMDNISKFGTIDNKKVFEALIEAGQLFAAAGMNAKEKKPWDKELAMAYEIAGEFLDPKLYLFVKDISEGKINEEAVSLGIKEGGKVGFDKLKEVVLGFGKNILKEDFDPRVIVDLGILKGIFKKLIRYGETSYGIKDEGMFVKVIEKYSHLRLKKEIASVNSLYKPSEPMRVDNVDKQEQNRFKFSEHFLGKFNVMKNSILEALWLVSFGDKPLSFIQKKIDRKRVDLIHHFQNKLKTMENPKAKINLEKKIHLLKDLSLRNVRALQKNFNVLAQFDEFYESLRQFVFFLALRKHKEYRQPVYHYLEKSEPLFEDLEYLMNFIDNIVNHEMKAQYFTDQEAADKFRMLLSTKTFSEEFFRAQNQETIGTTSLQFFPTRGILLEFSGNIADACWGGKYESIAKQFPNFSSITMVQNPGTKDERLAGSTMLIETKSDKGEPLLVIRGLNPIENLINKLSVPDFYEKFISYMKGIAEASGRKLAIVVDDCRGRAGTNREAMYGYLNERYRKASKPKVVLESDKDTTFNDLNVKNECYLVE